MGSYIRVRITDIQGLQLSRPHWEPKKSDLRWGVSTGSQPLLLLRYSFAFENEMVDTAEGSICILIQAKTIVKEYA